MERPEGPDFWENRLAQKELDAEHALKDHRKCPHRRKEVKIWGRREKYRAVVCKDCGLLLDIRKVKKGEVINE